MRVLIIGGTGFLGYHSCRELLERGHEVSLMGLPPLPEPGVFPPSVAIELGDISTMSDTELRQSFESYDTVIFAAGADDRTVPTGPAYQFFYAANVRSTIRVSAAARTAGVQRFVLLGSYFTYFDREWPEMELSRKHPYILSRREQMELGAAVAGNEMAFITLELPYIFGAMPGKVPLWQPLVNYVRSGVALYYTNGGTNMVAVERVAEAIAGACERIDHSCVFQIGDRNISWTEFLQGLCAALDRKDNRVRIIKDASVHNVGWIGEAFYRLHGKESGLNPSNFIRLQTAYTYLDPAESRDALGYSKGGLERAWRDTVAACPVSDQLSSIAGYVTLTRKLLRRDT